MISISLLAKLDNAYSRGGLLERNEEPFPDQTFSTFTSFFFFFFPFSRLGPQAFPPLPLEEFDHVKAFTQDLAEAVDVQDFKKIKEQLRRSKRY
jgi:hypothetical protein